MNRKQDHKHTSIHNNPTFSSTLLNQIYLSIDRDSYSVSSTASNNHASAADDGCRLSRLLDQDRKMSTLRRARLVEKWMEKPTQKSPFPLIDPPPRRQQSSPVVPAVATPVDEDPDSFFSTTSMSSSDSSTGGFSSTASDAETPSFNGSSKPRTSCFGPLRVPKPVRTTTKGKASTSEESEEDCSANKSSSSSRAVKIYTQLKSLKQPISPGLKLTRYINSFFVKESPTDKKKKNRTTPSKESDSFAGKGHKFRGIPVPERKYKSEQTSPEPSFSASSLTKTYVSSKGSSSTSALPSHDAKRTVKLCPVSVIVGGESRPCGMKMASESSASKRYEELRTLNFGGVSRVDDRDELGMSKKVLEDVAMDLLSSYWNRRNNNNDGDDEDDNDDSSCSSSDLFELDHLSLIGNSELPVYETTHLS